ncbi:AAA family ATPase [[Clostridium] innocuum]|nr:AAA family ATPase [[Clostridium] innocuum]
MNEFYNYCPTVSISEWRQITQSRNHVKQIDKKSTDRDVSNMENLIKLLPKLSKGNQKTLLDEKGKELQDYIQYLESVNDTDISARAEYLKILPFLPKPKNSCTHVADVFDEMIFPNGIMDGGLYVISGIPGGGKTAFCCMLSACLISGNNPFLTKDEIFPSRPVIYVSLEQDRQEIEMRIVSTLSALNDVTKAVAFSDLLSGKGWENPYDVEMAIRLFSLHQKRLSIITCRNIGYRPNISSLLENIEQKAQKFDDIPLVVIDQYVNIDGTDDNVSSDVVMHIKNFAQRTKMPVFVQTQLTKQSLISSTGKEGKVNGAKLTGSSLVGTSSINQQSIGTLILSDAGEECVLYGQRAKLIDINVCKMRYGSDKGCTMWYIGAWNLFVDSEKKDTKIKKAK